MVASEGDVKDNDGNKEVATTVSSETETGREGGGGFTILLFLFPFPVSGTWKILDAFIHFSISLCLYPLSEKLLQWWPSSHVFLSIIAYFVVLLIYREREREADSLYSE